MKHIEKERKKYYVICVNQLYVIFSQYKGKQNVITLSSENSI